MTPMNPRNGHKPAGAQRTDVVAGPTPTNCPGGHGLNDAQPELAAGAPNHRKARS